jgi:hypothetical protein
MLPHIGKVRLACSGYWGQLVRVFKIVLALLTPKGL